MTDVRNYQCPACTGPLHFGTGSGKLECEYCGSVFEPDEIAALYESEEGTVTNTAAHDDETQIDMEEKEWDLSAMDESWTGDGEKMLVYNCPSCGAELICDENTAATACPYCGNPSIVARQLEGALRPDYVIPFRIDKKQAVAALKRHYNGKKLLPREFVKDNHIEEVKGIYVPFWLFDGEAHVDARYLATRVMTHRQGDYRVTVTQHFSVRRAGTLGFERIPVDASSKMPDAYMDSIEPFDYSDLTEFSTAYLPGFLADKYDVTVEDASSRADERARRTALDSVRSTVIGYATSIPGGENVSLKRGDVKYALLPVWLLHTKWQGKDFLFAMNGQSGKMIGDLPVSRKRFWGWFAGIYAASAAVLAALMLLL